MAFDYYLIVIGSALAGNVAALRAARRGASVAALDRDARL